MVDDELIDIFIQESKEHLDALEPEILELENASSDSEGVNTIFRGVHSIKGSSGFFGFDQIAKLSHVMENVMALVREGDLAPTKMMVDVFLECTDKLKLMIDDPQNSGSIPIDDDVVRLEALITPGEEGAEAPGPKVNQSVELPKSMKRFVLDPLLIKNAISHGHLVFVVELYMNKDIKDHGKTPYDYFKEIESLGEFLDAAFDFSSIRGLDDVMDTDLMVHFLFTTVMGSPDMITSVFDIPADQVEEIDVGVLKEWLGTDPSKVEPESRSEEVFLEVVEDDAKKETEPAIEAEAEAPKKETPAVVKKETKDQQAKTPVRTKKADETIRVSVSLLDDMMNLAGEMVLSRNQLIRIAEKSGQEVSGLQGVIQNMNLVTSEMHERVMQTRLQPLGIIFSKFNRIIRDLSNKLSKEIKLDIEGEDVELDKSIIESLSDPLTHLIRNTADHGIEPPDEREAAGKPRIGSARLTAKHVGGQVMIQISDDGRGIDAEKLKRKAIDKGLLTPEEADAMSERQAFSIIFLPGFSTAEQVSDVSGRGVGMDVVRTNIEKLGGFIDIDSELGRGTTISLRLPLTLAIIPAMIVGAGGLRYAIPQVNLEEVVRLGGRNKTERIRGTRVLRLRDSLLTLLDLSDVLELENNETTNEEKVEDEEVEDEGYVLVLNLDNHQYGLVVNELFDSEEIAVKPISTFFKEAGCYSGVTIMGDGRVAMILDIAGIADLAKLDFESIENAATSYETEELSGLETGDSESLLLFRNEGFELFAINLSTVARIEKISAQDIENVGKGEYLNLGGKSIQLIRMHDHMPVAQPESSPEELYVLIPKLVRKPIGIIATQIVDTVQTVVELDKETITGTGILGSTFINESLVLVVDIYNLFESVDPELYQVPHLDDKYQSLKVLLVENNIFFRNVQQQFLTQIFGTVVTARNGVEAWEKLNDDNFHMVFTEVELSDMDGMELTRRMRATDKLKHIPVIATASRNEGVYATLSLEKGADRFMMKFDKQKTYQTIQEVFDTRTPLLAADSIAAE
ncbi:MAG: chemotaxis protein CheW [Opitutales bacterium]|nr:chemotaxis protein CheW [Opitutales bacterium]